MSEEIDAYWEIIDATDMTDRNIDDIIAYMRKQRGMIEKGIKPKKAEGPKKTLDLAALGLTKRVEAPSEPPSKRRSW
jgi:hypothetical protein